MSASNYAENKIADHALGTTSWTAPSAIYIKLHTGDPGEDCTSNAAGETTRKVVTFGSGSGGVATSDADAAWTSVSTTETYSHFSLWDAVSAGNPIAYGALDASVAVTAGDDFTISSGDLTVTVT